MAIQAWYERLQAWKEKTEERLRKKWWLWLLLLIPELLWHRLYSTLNEFLDSHSGMLVTTLSAVLLHLPPDPIMFVVIGGLLIFFSLAVHAYFETRASIVEGETPPVVSVPEADTSTRPKLTGEILHYKRRLLLTIKNDGPPAEVWARITVAGDTLYRCSEADAVWDHNSSSMKSLIATGETRSIRIAESRHADKASGSELFKYYWWVYYFEDEKLVITRSIEATLPYKDSTSTARQEVSIAIFSDPPSLTPIRCSLTLRGLNIVENVQGIAYTPESGA